MKIGIMQPYFFPYIGYWQLIKSVDKFVIYDDVNFINKGWINRNRILINGEVKVINVQLSAASQNKLINEIDVVGDVNYNKKFLKTIENYYKKAPYFNEIFPIIEDVICSNEKNLAKYLEYSIKSICDYLLIDTELMVSSTIDKNTNYKGKNKIIEICKLLDADYYYNAIGGKELYSYEDFASQNIELRFIKTESYVYKQFNNIFIPNLSIIDVMMFNSREEIIKALDNYSLINDNLYG